MKIILTLVGSSLLLGCANSSMPEFPSDIRAHYMVEVRDEEIPPEIFSAVVNANEIPHMAPVQVARCLHFDIISKVPYKIKFLAEEPMKECNGVGGYKPDNTVSLLNWIEDVSDWSKTKKKCFR